VVRLAVDSKLHQIVIITGSECEKVEEAIKEIPVTIVRNPDWQKGQGSSIRVGVHALPKDIAACIFFMCDQPLIQKELVDSIKDAYTRNRSGIIAPCFKGRRGNPVLFDRSLFSQLSELPDTEGGRTLFSNYPVTYIEWKDDSILFDVDTPEDYEQLKGMDA
jgi:molybdenum cofactor cytidylyltransferase